MKKLTSLVLAIIMILQLTACKGATTSPATAPQTSTPTAPSTLPPTDPTGGDPIIDEHSPEERYLLYLEIVRKLFQYTERGGVFGAISAPGGPYQGNAGLEYCYQQLLTMEDLDPYLAQEGWVESVYPIDLPAEWFDRKAVLSRFTMIEDVPLGLVYIENPSGFNEMNWGEKVIWRYNTKGQLVHLAQSSYFDTGTFRLPQNRFYNELSRAELYYEYNDNGELIRTWFGDNQTAETPIITTYDDTGRLSSETAMEQTLLYFYNDRGDLSKVRYLRVTSINGDEVNYTDDYWDFTYEYDNEGYITRCVEKEYKSGDLFFTRTYDYLYDENGRVCTVYQSTDVWQWFAEEPFITQTIKNTFRYTYDEQGRILTKSTCAGGELDVNGNPTAEVVLKAYNYLYGNHYIFDEYEVEFVKEK